MTDPDTIAAFNAIQREIDSKQPTPLEEAVIRHIEDEAEPLPPIPGDLSLPPTDDEVFDGVPKAPLADVPTAPMRLPQDTIPNPFVSDDDDWENEETGVYAVPTRVGGPDDPTGCMM